MVLDPLQHLHSSTAPAAEGPQILQQTSTVSNRYAISPVHAAGGTQAQRWPGAQLRHCPVRHSAAQRSTGLAWLHKFDSIMRASAAVPEPFMPDSDWQGGEKCRWCSSPGSARGARQRDALAFAGCEVLTATDG